MVSAASVKYARREKSTIKSMGPIPEKEADANSWEVLCVDCISPYAETKNKRVNYLYGVSP